MDNLVSRLFIDVRQPSSPLILSTLRTQGSVKECSIIFNETFLLCTARYKSQLQLIDLRDAKNPNILQVFNYQDIDGGLNICVIFRQNSCLTRVSKLSYQIKYFPQYKI
ncbi:hypothetical protein ABPG72_021988 [Tetrahymena utriculariae]